MEIFTIGTVQVFTSGTIHYWAVVSYVELFTIGTVQVFTIGTIHYWAAVSYVELQFPCFPPRLFLSLSLCPVQFVFLVQRSRDLILSEPFQGKH